MWSSPIRHRVRAALAPPALLALLAVGIGSALAQPPRSGTRADPLDAAASVPAARHRSAFEHYRRLGDAPAVPWRQANDTVERIGGWRSYAREATAPAAAASPSASAAPAAPAAPGAAGTVPAAASGAAPAAASAPGATRGEPARAPSGHHGHRP